MQKIATSAYHPKGNGGVERVNDTMAEMLAMAINERQDDWNVHSSHVEFSCNNSVNAASGPSPNDVHMNHPPRLPLAMFEHHYARGHQSLARGHVEYCDLAADPQRRAYALVREQHALTVSRVERRNSALSDAIKLLNIYTVRG